MRKVLEAAGVWVGGASERRAGERSTTSTPWRVCGPHESRANAAEQVLWRSTSKGSSQRLCPELRAALPGMRGAGRSPVGRGLQRAWRGPKPAAHAAGGGLHPSPFLEHVRNESGARTAPTGYWPIRREERQGRKAPEPVFECVTRLVFTFLVLCVL